MVNPFRYQLSQFADDPFALKSKSKLSPTRLLWTAQSRVLQNMAKSRHHSMADILDLGALQIHHTEEGGPLEDTAVTSNHMDILLAAAKKTVSLGGPFVEIGAYRGVTTKTLATVDGLECVAVDPFIGYGGAEDDFEVFKRNTDNLASVRHLRTTSGAAVEQFEDQSIAMAFIDAVHDVSNSWFDSISWSRKIKVGGILAMHDVDDHAGSGLSGRHFVKVATNYRPWAYAPNILCLERVS